MKRTSGDHGAGWREQGISMPSTRSIHKSDPERLDLPKGSPSTTTVNGARSAITPALLADAGVQPSATKPTPPPVHPPAEPLEKNLPYIRNSAQTRCSMRARPRRRRHRMMPSTEGRYIGGVHLLMLYAESLEQNARPTTRTTSMAIGSGRVHDAGGVHLRL
jgi:phosphoglucosamine mutase